MARELDSADLPITGPFNKSFILRFTWENESGQRQVQLRPVDDGETRVFPNLEAAFLYLAQHYTDQK